MYIFEADQTPILLHISTLGALYSSALGQCHALHHPTIMLLTDLTMHSYQDFRKIRMLCEEELEAKIKQHDENNKCGVSCEGYSDDVPYPN